MAADILDATHRRPMRMLEEDVCIGCPSFLVWPVDCGIGVCCAPSKEHDNPKFGNWPATFGQHGIAECCPHFINPDGGKDHEA